MYRGDDFMIKQTEVETGDCHDLAEAIRRGCKLRPKKVRRYFQRGDTMACALGAAAGVGNRRPKRQYTWWGGLLEIFPELNEEVTHPLTRERMSLGDVIVALNDDTAYSREAIADWLCRDGGCERRLMGPTLIPTTFKPGPGLKIAIGGALRAL
jgi:hypothetical protein